MSVALHATCFDASALVKRYIDEPGSDVLRQYWSRQATRYTTPFCLYETLSILKGYTRRKEGTITKARYLQCATDLVAWFRASSSRIQNIDLTDMEVFHDAKALAEQYPKLDLSDAFQLLTLEAGFFAPLVGGSQTLLVTADEALATAARHKRLPVWDCVREPMPAS